MKCLRLLAGLLSVALVGRAFASDLAKVERSIAKEPAYQNKPGYALLLFGPEAQSRVWLVLDGRFKDHPLPKGSIYVDRNANGNLAESGERLEFQSFGDGELTDRTAPLGCISERGLTHEILELRQRNISWPNEPPLFRMSISIGGRYSQITEIEFADSPAEAPIFPFDAPLVMLAYPDGQEFRAGDKTGLATVSIGTAAHGPGELFVKVCSSDFPTDLHPVAEIVFPFRQGDKPLPPVSVTLDGRC
jgi:hypothetical protein